MKRILLFLHRLERSLRRFPLAIISVMCLCISISLLIESNSGFSDEQLLRFVFTFIFGFFCSVSARFVAERFSLRPSITGVLYIAVCTAVLLYYLFLTSPAISDADIMRLFVMCFTLLCGYLYITSYKQSVAFTHVSLSHLKAFFIAVLYSGILFLGLSAIYYAIDLLLINMEEEIMAHLANWTFLFFAPTYYLSLLPKFNDREENEKNQAFYHYPKFLQILVSYILIPLITVYTLVLLIYFLKIAFTLEWPIGQIGPMVLVYSAAGLFIYILCRELDNKFAKTFRKIFPFLLIPIVAMQIASVIIRLLAYGFTESRYYVFLFGIYSVACSLYLIFSKTKRTGIIVLLAGCFAVISLVPPMDAFTVSRVSQTNRIEQILNSNQMLQDGTVVPNGNISQHDKNEIISIVFYMEEMGYLKNVTWIPEEYSTASIERNFNQIFGFDSYGYATDEFYFDIYAETPFAVDSSGYEQIIRYDIYDKNNTETVPFVLNEQNYELNQATDGNNEVILIVSDQRGSDIWTLSVNDLVQKIRNTNILSSQSEVPVDSLTFDYGNDDLKIRVVFEQGSVVYYEDGSIENIYATVWLLFAQNDG